MHDHAFMLQRRLQRIGDPIAANYDACLQLNLSAAGQPLVSASEAADLVKTIAHAQPSPED